MALPIQKKVEYIGPAYIRSNAARKARLINFDTSYKVQGYTLKDAHKAELDQMLVLVSHTTDFFAWIVGYASKRGDSNKNKTLSWNRALAVENHLRNGNSLFADVDRIDRFDGAGDTSYRAPTTDNSEDERAVEVHIFFGRVKPIPPHLPYLPSPHPPLPGGPRFSRWAIASPGGMSVAAGLGGAFNIFLIKNVNENEIRGYIQPSIIIGAGVGLPSLGLVGRIIQTILTGASGSSVDFVPCVSPEPLTWAEVEASAVHVVGAGAGAVKGYAWAEITFRTLVTHNNQSGWPSKTSMIIWNYKASGQDWQLGISATDGWGPLKRIDD